MAILSIYHSNWMEFTEYYSFVKTNDFEYDW